MQDVSTETLARYAYNYSMATNDTLSRKLDRIERSLNITWLVMAAMIAVQLWSIWKQTKPAAPHEGDSGLVRG